MQDLEDLKWMGYTSISLSIFNEQDESSFPRNVYWPRLIDSNCGRSIHLFIQFIQILDITVDNDPRNTLLPNVIEFKLGRSNCDSTHIIPLITNEDQ